MFPRSSITVARKRLEPMRKETLVPIGMDLGARGRLEPLGMVDLLTKDWCPEHFAGVCVQPHQMIVRVLHRFYASVEPEPDELELFRRALQDQSLDAQLRFS